MREIREIAMREGVSMTELANRIGISRQALYGRLRGRVSYDTVRECLGALGYSLYYGKDGKVKKVE